MNLPTSYPPEQRAADGHSASHPSLDARSKATHIFGCAAKNTSYHLRCTEAIRPSPCFQVSPSIRSVRLAHRPSRLTLKFHVYLEDRGRHRTGDPKCRNYSSLSAWPSSARRSRAAFRQTSSAQAWARPQARPRPSFLTAILPQARLWGPRVARCVTTWEFAAANAAQNLKFQKTAYGNASCARFFVVRQTA